jgi:hypothetical protein
VDVLWKQEKSIAGYSIMTKEYSKEGLLIGYAIKTWNFSAGGDYWGKGGELF